MWIKHLLRRPKASVQQMPRPQEYHDNPWQQTQNDFMRSCLAKHGARVRAVLHVGGHLGEEYPIYKQAGAQKIVFFEPMPDVFKELTRRLGGREDVGLVRMALGSRNEVREIHINRGSGESTSFLKPTNLYDGYFEDNTLPLEVATLDSFLPSLSNYHVFNVLVTDTQGFDLEVLKGAQKTLAQIDYIYTEVSKGHYHEEPRVEDFDGLLNPFGFRRAETSMYGSWKGEDQWGDVFYTKNDQST